MPSPMMPGDMSTVGYSRTTPLQIKRKTLFIMNNILTLRIKVSSTYSSVQNHR